MDERTFDAMLVGDGVDQLFEVQRRCRFLNLHRRGVVSSQPGSDGFGHNLHASHQAPGALIDAHNCRNVAGGGFSAATEKAGTATRSIKQNRREMFLEFVLRKIPNVTIRKTR